jgi:hypothetical protein
MHPTLVSYAPFILSQFLLEKVLGCYIFCNESLVEVDRLIVEVEDIESKLKVGVVQLGKLEIEDIDKKLKVKVVRPGKVEFKDIDNKSKRSTNKRSTCRHVESD